MIRSMTGYGRAEGKGDGISCVVEMRSVNNKYLDISLRVPVKIFELEERIRKFIKSNFSRGSFEVFISFENGSKFDSGFSIDKELANKYITSIRGLKDDFMLGGDVDIHLISQMKGIFQYEDTNKKIEPYIDFIVTTLGDAVSSLKTMREAEGGRLWDDIVKRLDIIKDRASRIEAMSATIVTEYKDRLTVKLSDLLEGKEINKDRLYQEVAMIAERTDITEELTRLNSHLDYFKNITKEEHAALGRKLEFILQEINRETNTIGSKTSNYNVSMHVIEIKGEIEKIREQVQNIE